MKVILLHGKDTDPALKWYPQFVADLQRKGIVVAAPALPRAADPDINEWIEVIDSLNADENTVLVGHSRGGVAILRWLERLPETEDVRKVILVAANSGRVDAMDYPAESNFGFYTDKGYDFNAIKRHCNDFVVIHSQDDPWVSFAAGEENAKALEATFYRLDGYKHFGKPDIAVPHLLDEVISVA